MTVVQAADRWLAGVRRTTWGDTMWLLVIAWALLCHAIAAVHPWRFPERSDFAPLLGTVVDWRAGINYASTNINPNIPVANLLYLPLTHLPLLSAVRIWMVVSYAAAAWCLTRAVRVTDERWPIPVAISGLALFLGAPATFDHISSGNMIWMIWPIATGAWLSARRGQSATSGVLVGLLVGLKPFFAIWFPYYVVKRDWRALVSSLTATTLAVSTAWLVFGHEHWKAWIDAVGRIDWYGYEDNASIAALLARAGLLSASTWFASATVFSLVSLWWLWKRHGSTSYDWLLLTLTVVLTAPLGWRYYLTFALGPALDWISHDHPDRRQRLVLLALVVCPAVSAEGHSALYGLTVASLLFWLLLAAWMLIGARGSAASPALTPMK